VRGHRQRGIGTFVLHNRLTTLCERVPTFAEKCVYT
jgi:hypothetical protein